MNKTLSQAKVNLWTRCPKCHHLVEKRAGCLTIWCLCGTEFCYRCGGYSSGHSCANQCQYLSSDHISTIRSQMFTSTTANSTNKIRRIN
ncbi:hypothetical protein BD408DRAFT_415527 [Parasitella parasitica]|nr:hypothetical protein BD408DRAFT_415527 [Parasitella parasitica]